MKILHICQRDDPDTGGSLRVAEALAREQRAAGMDVGLLFLYGEPSHIATAFGSHAICLGLDSSRQIIKGVHALHKAIKQIAPDIIHSHDGIVWPRLVLSMFSLPVVMHSHLPAGASDFKSKIGWMLIKKTTNRLIGISTHTLETWIQAGYPASQIRHIPNGVDFDRFCTVGPDDKKHFRKKLGLPENARILLWVGRVHRSMKGSDRVERIAALLPENTVLVVVGNGPEYTGMCARCADLIKAGSLAMVGSTPTPEDYYKAADAFLFTSYHEPFGLVILEAVASGVPIMAFPVNAGGGAIDLLQEFGAAQLANEPTKREVAELLDKMVSRSDNAEVLREAAMSKYNWQSISREVANVYSSVLGVCSLKEDRLRVLVCQHGARHRYAVPRMLESSGVLGALYTDSSAESLLGKCVKLFSGWTPRRWRRFARWSIHGIPKGKVFSSDYSYLLELKGKLLMSQKQGIYLYQQRHRQLSSRMRQWGLQGANMIYSMYHENLDFVRWAKDHGAKSAVEVFVSPVTDQIMEEECAVFPDWGEAQDVQASVLERKLWKETAEVADILVCPSEWVAEGIRSVTPSAYGKVRIVPYGCSINYNGRVNQPIPGRILFAGRDALRKGLHYLAQAATLLKETMPDLEVRVAGAMPDVVQNHPVCKDLNFLGQLGGVQMENEFLSADVLILPALSEGFAGVVAEAIGAGCPVIVTKEAGSPIIHGREGLIVPSRDAGALADAMQRIVIDRPLREHCAAECLKQIPYYDEDKWRERLVDVLQEEIDG